MSRYATGANAEVVLRPNLDPLLVQVKTTSSRSCKVCERLARKAIAELRPFASLSAEACCAALCIRGRWRLLRFNQSAEWFSAYEGQICRAVEKLRRKK